MVYGVVESGIQCMGLLKVSHCHYFDNVSRLNKSGNSIMFAHKFKKNTRRASSQNIELLSEARMSMRGLI